MPSFLIEDLTQRMTKVLEPRYPTLFWENGDLIPTMADLQPGAREFAYENLTEYGDADVLSDGTVNIPTVNISVTEDRHPIYMIGAGFPISLQELRAYNATRVHQTTNLNRFQRRMQAARRVIAQKVNLYTAAGIRELNFESAMNNSNVPRLYSNVNPYGAITATLYQQLLDEMVFWVESMTDNYASMEPSTLLVSSNFLKKICAIQNPNGTTNVKKQIEELYPDLEIKKIKETEGPFIRDYVKGTADRPARDVGAGSGNSGFFNPTDPDDTDEANFTAPRDRFLLYPKESSIVNRHIESSVARLAPEDYARVEGLNKIYLMYTCVSPVVYDYPQDARYIEVKAGGTNVLSTSEDPPVYDIYPTP